jgi:hypothetical protein
VVSTSAGSPGGEVDPQQYRYGQPLGELFDGGAESAFGEDGRVDAAREFSEFADGVA